MANICVNLGSLLTKKVQVAFADKLYSQLLDPSLVRYEIYSRDQIISINQVNCYKPIILSYRRNVQYDTTLWEAQGCYIL